MTKIEWCNYMPGYKGETWNPIVGCSPISPGCEHCYAERMAVRLAGMGHENYEKVITDGRWNGTTAFSESALTKPLHWKKPRLVFLCSMGDFYHFTVKYEWMSRVFRIIESCPQHIFMILTKRARTMRDDMDRYGAYMFPKNLWIGVSAENQTEADHKIPFLLDIFDAPVKFVSIEPMLRSINISKYMDPSNNYFIVTGNEEDKSPVLDWVLCGGESGSGARPMHPDWPRSLRDQCVVSDVPFFFKQMSGRMAKERHSIPEDLMVREIPNE